jgi:hypothetical protein
MFIRERVIGTTTTLFTIGPRAIEAGFRVFVLQAIMRFFTKVFKVLIESMLEKALGGEKVQPWNPLY